jgi:hypothetical protein
MPLNVLDLIGDLANGAYGAPRANPNVGQTVNGQVIPPWQTPGFFARAFSPLAQQALQSNMAYLQNPALYQQQTQEQAGRAGTYANEPDYVKQGLSGMGDWNAGNVSEEQQRQADTGAGVFGKKATAAANLAGMTATQNSPNLYGGILHNLLYQNSILQPDIDAQQDLLARNFGLGTGSLLVLQKNGSNWTPAGNPINIMGRTIGGATGPTGKVTNLPPLFQSGTLDDSYGSPTQYANPPANQSTPLSASQVTVPTVPYHPVQPEDTRNLLSQGWHNLLSGLGTAGRYAVHNPADVAKTYATALLGSPAATAPTEEQVDAARNQLLSQGKRLHIGDGYEVDKDGNVYKNGVFVPEEQLKGTAVEKMRNSIMSFHKAAREHISSKNLHNQ